MLFFILIDINECVVGEHNCSGTHGACSDVVGGRDSFQCSCLPGYSGNGVDTCENVNECALGLDTCDDTSTDCVDTDGSFTCTCKDGFANGETGSCTSKSTTCGIFSSLPGIYGLFTTLAVKILTSAVLVWLNVMSTLTVLIPLAVTAVSVDLVTPEMEEHAV